MNFSVPARTVTNFGESRARARPGEFTKQKLKNEFCEPPSPRFWLFRQAAVIDQSRVPDPFSFELLHLYPDPVQNNPDPNVKRSLLYLFKSSIKHSQIDLFLGCPIQVLDFFIISRILRFYMFLK